MKHIHTYEDFLNESILSSKLEQAYSKIDSLPKGAIFDDSKRIDGIFDITKHSWSDVANAFEKNEKDAKTKSVNVKDIQKELRKIDGTLTAEIKTQKK